MFLLNINHASPETNTSFLTFCSFSIEPVVHYFSTIIYAVGEHGGIVVKALRHKPAGRGFDSRWCHWNFSVT